MNWVTLFDWESEGVERSERGCPEASGSLAGLKEHEEDHILCGIFLFFWGSIEGCLEHLELFFVVDGLLWRKGVRNTEGEGWEPQVRHESGQGWIVNFGSMHQKRDAAEDHTNS